MKKFVLLAACLLFSIVAIAQDTLFIPCNAWKFATYNKELMAQAFDLKDNAQILEIVGLSCDLNSTGNPEANTEIALQRAKNFSELLDCPNYTILPNTRKFGAPSKNRGVLVIYTSKNANDVSDSVESSDVTDSVESSDVTDSVESSDVTDNVESSDVTDNVESSDVTDNVESSDVTDNVQTATLFQLIQLQPLTATLQLPQSIDSVGKICLPCREEKAAALLSKMLYLGAKDSLKTVKDIDSRKQLYKNRYHYRRNWAHNETVLKRCKYNYKKTGELTQCVECIDYKQPQTIKPNKAKKAGKSYSQIHKNSRFKPNMGMRGMNKARWFLPYRNC